MDSHEDLCEAIVPVGTTLAPLSPPNPDSATPSGRRKRWRIAAGVLNVVVGGPVTAVGVLLALVRAFGGQGGIGAPFALVLAGGLLTLSGVCFLLETVRSIRYALRLVAASLTSCVIFLGGWILDSWLGRFEDANFRHREPFLFALVLSLPAMLVVLAILELVFARFHAGEPITPADDAPPPLGPANGRRWRIAAALINFMLSFVLVGLGVWVMSAFIPFFPIQETILILIAGLSGASVLFGSGICLLMARRRWLRAAAWLLAIALLHGVCSLIVMHSVLRGFSAAFELLVVLVVILFFELVLLTRSLSLGVSP